MDGVFDLYPSNILLLLVGLAILVVSAWLAHREPFSRIKI
jgi:hypothetical protein